MVSSTTPSIVHKQNPSPCFLLAAPLCVPDSCHSVEAGNVVAQPCLREAPDCTPCRAVGSSPVQQPHHIDGRKGSYRHLLHFSLVLAQQPLNGFLSSTGIRCLTLYPDLFRVTSHNFCEQCFSQNRSHHVETTDN